MSVQNVTKMWSKTGGALSSTSAGALDQHWSITEGYQVLAEIGDNIVTIQQAADLPALGDQHVSGVNAYAISITPQQISPIFWQVLVGYEGDLFDVNVSVEWGDVTTTEPIDRDINGAAIVTANGEQVEGLTMDVADQVVVISRKFATVDTASVAKYRRATNSDTYLGWAPGTARLVGFSARNRFRFNSPVELWDVTARIQFREPYANTTTAQAWYKRWRHEGLLIKKNGVIQRAQDGIGQETTKPVLIKANGEQETDPDLALFNHTQIYGSLPYAGLGML